jgi:CBS-domain-containing membrane protein
MPMQNAPHRDKSHRDGRANLLRHHILTLGTNNDTESDKEFLIGIVDSVELGKRLRLLREKAQNKRMKNPSLTAQESLQDEVAYVMTTTSLLNTMQMDTHCIYMCTRVYIILVCTSSLVRVAN